MKAISIGLISALLCIPGFAQNDHNDLDTSGTSATAGTYHVFPQFADGQLSDGTSYRTTLMISNPSSTISADCTLQLRGLTVPGFGLNYALGPGGWTIASTAGTQRLQTGYATLQCNANIEAQLLYSYYLSNGTKLSEATVFSSPPGSKALVVADQREGAQLGIAIANDSDQSVTYTVSMSGASGTGTLTLAPRSSAARFISQLVPGIPAGSLGVVQVSSSTGSASIIGLRFTERVFTTIPESISGSVLPTASTQHVFPQFADGRFSDGSYYRTTGMYINSSSNANTDCVTQLRGVTSDGEGNFTASLSPGKFVVRATNGTQSFQAGYATMQCSSPVDAQELYSYYAANGTKLAEATVFSSPAARSVQILADSREGAQIGLAIANDSEQSNTYNILAGNAGGTVTLGPRATIAKFLNEFVTLPANYVGPVIVSSDTGTASIIGLRYTGTVFTTIPETIQNLKTGSRVLVNGRELTPGQVAELRQLYGMAPPEGRYWYDPRSGLYGYWGFEAAGYIRPGHNFGPLPSQASRGNTGTFLNGREINAVEAEFIRRLFGVVYKGYFWLDGSTGNLGVEGNTTPLANVVTALQAQRWSSGEYHWRDGSGAVVSSSGSCTFAAIPGAPVYATPGCN
ncbi:MAG TPA: hypothetical protein VE422_16075 [Terriglobia bacterium]|nr:hypothetical protein [Terriglobia bacterium]